MEISDFDLSDIFQLESTGRSWIVDQDGLQTFARALASVLSAGDWIFLEGDLGAGKTTLAQGLLRAFGAQDAGQSPTFPVLTVTDLPTAVRGIQKILHGDLYRLKKPEELCYLGFEMEFLSQSTIAIWEWPETFGTADWCGFFAQTGSARPERLLRIELEVLESHSGFRRLTAQHGSL